ncbi:MAG: MATE family efflux transporter [archaeon]|nr:MATE family efflux transporter [archaeon]
MTEETEGVRTLLGNPRKALVAMAIPIAIASIVQSTNNIIDAVWVAGLGTGALAATGVLFPYFFILLGIGNGIGVGASQAIARRIGARDPRYNDVASQAFMMALVSGLVLSILFIIILRPLLAATGAGDYLTECVDYGAPLLGFGVITVFCSMFGGILRAEGAAKRAMLLQVLGAGLNLVLDPIFIYVLDLGVAGAAWATVISMGISLVPAFHWYFIRKDTFVRIPLRGFRFDREVDIDILKVGIPASLEMILISLCAMGTNIVILMVDPADGIAVFTTGWRILDLLMIPAMSIGFAVVPICAAAYGAREIGKMHDTYFYACRTSLLVCLALTAITFLCAPYFVAIFTYGEGSSHLAGAMTDFLRICCLMLPVTGLGFPSTSLFQSLGMGLHSLFASLLMNLTRLPLCYVAAIVFGTMTSLTYGILFSEYIGSATIFVWGVVIARRMLREHHA